MYNLRFEAHSPAKRSNINVRRRLTLKLNSDIILFVVVVLQTIESELYILHISLIHCAKPICGTSSGAAQRVQRQNSSRERERECTKQDRVPRVED